MNGTTDDLDGQFSIDALDETPLTSEQAEHYAKVMCALLKRAHEPEREGEQICLGDYENPALGPAALP